MCSPAGEDKLTGGISNVTLDFECVVCFHALHGDVQSEVGEHSHSGIVISTLPSATGSSYFWNKVAWVYKKFTCVAIDAVKFEVIVSLARIWYGGGCIKDYVSVVHTEKNGDTFFWDR